MYKRAERLSGSDSRLIYNGAFPLIIRSLSAQVLISEAPSSGTGKRNKPRSLSTSSLALILAY